MHFFKGFLTFICTLFLAASVQAATLSVQTSLLTGLQYTYATAAAGGDVFANTGREFVLIVNANASTRTVTFDAVPSTDKPGFGTIVLSDTVVTIPGSGTNSGRILIGPFPPDRFNNSSGQVSVTYSDSAADLTIAVIKLPSAL